MSDILETFYAIDFDRCLSDTNRLNDIFYAVVGRYKEIDVDRLKQKRKEVEEPGGTYDQTVLLRELLSTDQLVELLEAFQAEAKQYGVLTAGSAELLGAIEARGFAFGIVSYGSIAWQSAKIKASGLEQLPSMIIDHKEKGKVIAQWQQPDKTFVIPAGLFLDGISRRAKTVVLIDDKASAFPGLPKEARGYWMQSTTEPLLPSQVGTVPENVKIAHGMHEIVTFETL